MSLFGLRNLLLIMLFHQKHQLFPLITIYHLLFTNASRYDPRLSMFNLRRDELNALSESERETIWLPVLNFDNTKRKDVTVNDGKTQVVILRKGRFERSPIDQLDNSYIFKGAEK